MKQAPKWFTETFIPAMKIFIASHFAAGVIAVAVIDNGPEWRRQALIALAERGIEL